MPTELRLTAPPAVDSVIFPVLFYRLLGVLPLARLFGFGPLPISFLLIVGIIIALYLIAAEITKTVFYRKVKV